MPELQPMVEHLARLTRFEGFCGFDWIQEETTGRHYLIEFHPRATSGYRFSNFCGVNFSAAITAWLKQETEKFPTQVQPMGNPVAAHYFTCDLLRCFRQHDWQGLKAWFPGSGAVHDIFWDDIPLFAAWGIQRISQRFRKRSTPTINSKLLPL